jgi:rhamnopyranosyl-N-acetylglucosaminyl-diphospho-decaprenol beta-1,3/1,4-galactofuranosyltransferase
VSRVVAVVITLNRRELLLECLAGLERQTHPLSAVVVVDNSSTDGTDAALRAWCADQRLPVHFMNIRDVGGPQAWHLAARHALTLQPDWLWFLDDDSEPTADALRTLLASQAAARPQTALLAPAVATPQGEMQLMHRGRLRRRLLRPPMTPLPQSAYAGEHRIGYATYVGPLVRASAAVAAGLPVRDWFMWMDDTEYSERLSRHGELWLVPDAVVHHKDGRGRQAGGALELLRRYARPIPFSSLWRNMYGLRNLIFWGRRSGYVSAPAAYGFVAQYLLLALLFGPARIRRAQLCLEFARQGRSGSFVNVTAADWRGLETAPDIGAYLRRHALSYDDEAPAVEILAGLSA